MKFVIKICLWLLAFVPLIVDQSVFYPMVMGKNLLIESCLVLAGVLILINFFYSRDFREEIISKIISRFKHPLVLSLSVFIFVSIIGTILAVDQHTAFWGELSRVEGLAGLIFFFSFFTFSLLMFEKKDWLWFFKLSLFVTLFLLIKQFTQLWGEGVLRPGSFIGNPTFLAGFLLFSISASLIVLNWSKDWFFKYFSSLIIVLSLIGIFIAQTRGTVLGFVLGLVAVLIFLIFKGKEVNYKRFNLRQVAIILLSLGIIFSGIFIFTRKNEVWQKIPGLARVALIGSAGDSAVPRLLTLETSFQAVNPISNGWKKLLLGWGPENYILAHGQYYNPAQYQYEANWFDRAHNKLLDVLVMIGLFGLLAYLAIWFTFFKFLFKKSTPQSSCPAELERSGVSEMGLLTNISLLFFGVSFFTHLMFTFDQISTSVPFWAILAFTVYLTVYTPKNEPKMAQNDSEIRERREILSGCFLVILTLFLGFIYFRNTLPAYFQMKNYLALIKEAKPTLITEKLDSVLGFSTSAEMDIKRDLLRIAVSLSGKKLDNLALTLADKALVMGDDYVQKNPVDLRFLSSLADAYTSQGYIFKREDYLKKGEGYYQKILKLAPTRPDMIFGLALNAFYQQRVVESFDLLEQVFTVSPVLFKLNKLKSEVAYTGFLKYFYEQRDKENFIKTVDRLKENNYEDSASLDTIVNFLNTQGVWPKVNFN